MDGWYTTKTVLGKAGIDCSNHKNLCMTVIVIYLFRFESADTRFRSSATLGDETIELENVIKRRLRSSPHAPRMLNFLIDEFEGCQ